jgi:hypothetical protein
MSHLSILPTVYTRLDYLARALAQEGFKVQFGGCLDDVGSAPVPADLVAYCGDCRPLGWSRQADGSICLCGDLQRISSHTGLEARLQRVARRYALLFAIDQITIESDRLTTAAISLLQD